MTDVADYLAVANAYGPALSPDGERLAYLTDETGVLQLWTATSPTTVRIVPSRRRRWWHTRSVSTVGRVASATRCS